MDKKLFEIEESGSYIELTYSANKSMMSAEDLGRAILGMSTVMRIAGRLAVIDFDEVYISPIEEGSVKTIFKYAKKHRDELIVNTSLQVVAMIIYGSMQAFNTNSLNAYKNPNAEILKNLDPKVVTACLSGNYRKGFDSMARPLAEDNPSFKIKVGKDGEFEVTCENQDKFLINDDDEVLPELKDGDEVRLPGRLTRLNIDTLNDLGFEYHNRKLSLRTIDENENIVKYHNFLETPFVTVHGIVFRQGVYDIPVIKVIDMEVTQPKDKQIAMFEAKDK